MELSTFVALRPKADVEQNWHLPATQGCSREGALAYKRRCFMEDPMRGAHKVKEMKRRTSQRRAAHKARLAALTLKAETRRAAVEAGRGKAKVGSKGR